MFFKGCEIFCEKFKGSENNPEKYRGLKITRKILRGAKFPVPEGIRGMTFSSARENKVGNFFESPEFDFTQAPQSVRTGRF